MYRNDVIITPFRRTKKIKLSAAWTAEGIDKWNVTGKLFGIGCWAANLQGQVGQLVKPQGVYDVFLKQFFSGLGYFGTQPLNYVQTKEAFFRYNDQKKRR